MSGFDLCRRIRRGPETENTPVIFLTAKGCLMDMAEGQDAGSDLYLIKPVLARASCCTWSASSSPPTPP